MLHHYAAYGLNIASEIDCPQLAAGSGAAPDLTIRWGQVSLSLDQAQVRGKTYQVTSGNLLLDIKNVARYLVSGGREIRVEACPDAPASLVRLFLLGSAFGALLLQRGYWPLHGSSVAAAGGAVLFVGDSGSGKSSLAGALQRRGFPVLSDDVCALSFDPQGQALTWPAYPRLHLWSDSLAKLGESPDLLERRQTDLEKFELLLPKFLPDPLPVRVIYALHVGEGDSLSLSPLKGFEKIQTLTSNTYRLHFLHGMRLEQQHFQQAHSLARQARVVRVTRPHRPFLLEELADLIQKDFS